MFTDSQKAQIRLYLGYGDAFRYKHTRLESILDNISAESEAIVIATLAQIAAVDAQFASSAMTSAGIRRVDEIWFFPAEQGGMIAQLRNIGRQYIGRLSIILGVPIYGDYYGKGGWPGDNFSGLGGPRYGNGSYYGLG